MVWAAGISTQQPQVFRRSKSQDHVEAGMTRLIGVRFERDASVGCSAGALHVLERHEAHDQPRWWPKSGAHRGRGALTAARALSARQSRFVPLPPSDWAIHAQIANSPTRWGAGLVCMPRGRHATAGSGVWFHGRPMVS
jgi:hypothetical protein